MATRRAKTGLSHLDAARRPTMVGVGAKAITHRIAEAEARLEAAGRGGARAARQRAPQRQGPGV